MASTFSTNLAIELIGTGDQAGTWGTTTNSNLGTLIEQAISGYVTQAVVTGTDTTITIPNGATGVARNMYIELTGTGGTNTNLIVPANKKLYFIFNNSTGAVTVKVSGQTGVSVPTGKKMVLVSNGTDIVNGLNYIADFGTNSFSVTNLTASSGTITNLIATSGSITNLVSSDASATVLRAGSATLTHLSATSASITNLSLTSLTISSLSITNVSVASATVSSNLTLSGGTANGVLYLNGSKVATSGSALVFDGTNVDFGTVGAKLNFPTTSSSTKNYVGGSADGFSLEMVTQRGAIQPISYKQDYSVGHVWSLTGTGAMALTSTGLGIGTASPSDILTLAGGASGSYGLTINNAKVGGGTKAIFQYDATNAIALVGGNTTNGLAFQTLTAGSLTTKAVIDASGNLGLGVTPSAWSIKALQVNNSSIANDSNDTYIQSNAFFDGSWKYINSAEAAQYYQVNGSHVWRYAASGTAGAAISFTQAMTLTAAGDLGVGTTSPSTKIHAQAAGANIEIRATTTSSGDVRFGFDASGAYYNWIETLRSNGDMRFATNNAERGRFTAGGYFKASNAGTYESSTGSYHEARQSASGERVLDVAHTHASNPYGMQVKFTAASPDNNTNWFFVAQDSTTTRCYIWSDGDLANHDGVYGTISDQRLKQDIVDAGSQWDDLKAVRFRKYRMKTDVQANPNSPAMLGVVAQELEAVCPGLVDEHIDTDGETTKTVKSSILLMKAAVALQEAMARIETLEAKVAALESK